MIDETEVRLRHFRIHAEDCMLDRIERQITVAGDLTQEQGKRVLKIADKYPVHRTLASEVNIRTTLL